MRGARPAGVSSHSMKPGTASVISPPPTEVGGPQQGGLSEPSSASIEQTAPTGVRSAPELFRIPLILNGPVGPFFTCTM
jgi:hypothetical protein